MRRKNDLGIDRIYFATNDTNSSNDEYGFCNELKQTKTNKKNI